MVVFGRRFAIVLCALFLPLFLFGNGCSDVPVDPEGTPIVRQTPPDKEPEPEPEPEPPCEDCHKAGLRPKVLQVEIEIVGTDSSKNPPEQYRYWVPLSSDRVTLRAYHDSTSDGQTLTLSGRLDLPREIAYNLHRDKGNPYYLQQIEFYIPSVRFRPSPPLRVVELTSNPWFEKPGMAVNVGRYVSPKVFRLVTGEGSTWARCNYKVFPGHRFVDCDIDSMVDLGGGWLTVPVRFRFRVSY